MSEANVFAGCFRPSSTSNSLPDTSIWYASGVATQDFARRVLEGTKKWPHSWAGDDDDVPFGKEIVELMRPFLGALTRKNLSETSLRRHFDNAWLLGGEIIREVNLFAERRHEPAEELLLRMIGPHGGPFCRHINNESEQRSFDSTCRQLYEFVVANRRPTVV